VILKAIRVLTRKNEQLSGVAAAFVGHLHRNVAMPATAATKPRRRAALQRAGQKAPTPMRRAAPLERSRAAAPRLDHLPI